jgi:flagellar hook-associated protein 2
MDPVSSVSGLASGIQWSSLVDQLVQLDTTRQLTPLQTQQTNDQSAASAWTSYQSIITTLDTAAQALAKNTALASLNASVGTSASGRSLFTASADATATPGTYNIEVDALAAAEKVSGNIVAAGADSALGLSGTFSINGQAVTVAAGDTLADVRDKINAVNAGATPSGVSASILTSNDGAARIVLTSQNTGAAGIQLVDGASAATGIVSQLGFTDGSTAVHTAADGRAQSYGVSTTTGAIAASLGVTMPPPSTVTIGGVTISVDLSTDSLSSIVAKINAAGGKAAITTATVGSTTENYLNASGAVSASTSDGQRALELLGLVRGTRSSVQQSAVTDTALTKSDGSAIDTSTLLTDLGNGGPGGVQVGDTFTIRGSKADGTAVDTAFTVTGSSTVNDLLSALSSAFGTSGRPVSATLDNGAIRLTDTTGGDSQLAFTVAANNEGGGTLSFGATTTDSLGRLREVVAGADAQVRIDGVLVQRSTNTVSDALAGVTLTLQAAEVGSPATLTVSRDTSAATTTVQNFVTAYNAVVDATAQQLASGNPLANNSALRSTMQSITNAFLANVAGTSGTYTNPIVAGLSLDKTGHMQLDTTVFQNALAANPTAVAQLFSTSATTSTSVLSSALWSQNTKAGTYTAHITQAATTAAVTGSVLPGAYAAVGASDAITVNDTTTGKSVTVNLNDGDSVDTIAANLNAQFQAQKLNVVASNVGGALSLAGTSYGAGAKFDVSYSDPSIAAELGIAEQTYAGTDVQGSFTGTDSNGNAVSFAATGSGQYLTGLSGTDADGLVVRYTGTGTGDVGTVTFTLGMAGNVQRLTGAIIRPNDGTIATQVSLLNDAASALDTRIAAVQARLDIEQQTLTAQFTRMETVISQLQSQGSFLSNQISMMNAAISGTSSTASSGSSSSSSSGSTTG